MKTKTTARFAGLLYLLIAVFGGFAFFAGYESLIVKGDAVATTNNILDSELMFRVGIIGDSFTFLGEIILTILLYKLFKPVGKSLSQIAAFSRLAMTTMIGMNVLNKLLVLQLLSGADYLSAFQPEQIQALSMLFLSAYGIGSLIWGLFFALHLVIIGYLIIKSGYAPKILGILFVFASFGYLINSFGNFILPEYEAIYTIVVLATVPAELAFAFWLLIKGLTIDKIQNISYSNR
jgi:hypothetical protein